MNNINHYDTVSNAIAQLRDLGFNADVEVTGNTVLFDHVAVIPEELQIKVLYRYEGATDPADEAVVYGLADQQGRKGILISNYGADASDIIAKLINANQ